MRNLVEVVLVLVVSGVGVVVQPNRRFRERREGNIDPISPVAPVSLQKDRRVLGDIGGAPRRRDANETVRRYRVCRLAAHLGIDLLRRHSHTFLLHRHVSIDLKRIEQKGGIEDVKNN